MNETNRIDEDRAQNWRLYQGTKLLKATPMGKLAYCKLRGWDVPADEDPDQLGYVVEYQDGGEPNVEGFLGYVSWSPADVFERAYRPWNTYVERMRLEHDDLDEKVRRLQDFINLSATFQTLSLARRQLLESQYEAMRCYRRILSIRIDLEQGALAFETAKNILGDAASDMLHDEPAVKVGEPVGD